MDGWMEGWMGVYRKPVYHETAEAINALYKAVLRRNLMTPYAASYCIVEVCCCIKIISEALLNTYPQSSTNECFCIAPIRRPNF